MNRGMASKKNVDIPEITASTSAREQTPEESPSTSKSGSPDAGFMLFVGLIALTFGLALTVGPKFSWKLSQVTEGFAYLGIHGGTLLIGGVVISALGLIRRGQHALHESISGKQNEDLLEMTASDVVHLRTSVAAIQDSLDRMGQEMHGIENRMHSTLHEMSALTQTAIQNMPQPQIVAEPTNDQDANQEAIYRLAASLDQVGAKIDQRLRSQYSGLEEHLGGVLAAVASARDVMEQIAQKNLTERSAMPELPEPPPALGETAFRSNWSGMTSESAAPVLEPEPAPIAPEPAPIAHAPAPVAPEPPPVAQEPAPAPEPTAPEAFSAPVREQTSPTAEELDANPILNEAESLVDPLQMDPVHGGVENHAEHAAPVAPQSEPPTPTDTQTKLQQLSELLADEDLRDAFENEAP